MRATYTILGLLVILLSCKVQTLTFKPPKLDRGCNNLFDTFYIDTIYVSKGKQSVLYDKWITKKDTIHFIFIVKNDTKDTIMMNTFISGANAIVFWQPRTKFFLPNTSRNFESIILVAPNVKEIGASVSMVYWNERIAYTSIFLKLRGVVQK
jgi:hypothetical protein